MKRTEFINQFKTDVEAKISTANGYQTDIVNIKFGYVSFANMEPRPGFWYWVNRDEATEDMMDNEFYRILTFRVVGYTDDEDTTDYENVFKFAQDIENFLRSTDWTYATSTRLLGVDFSAGEVDQGHAQFDLTFSVEYYQDFDL
jgi:hypothetical protein